jgi:colanic acid biosynthesis glycosyl transferase WcaI
VLNQYYAPAFESTGQLLTQLCEGLVDEYDVTVLTGAVEGAAPAREMQNGVKVERVLSTTFERRRLALRAANYLTYVASSLGRALQTTRPDLVLCMSDPPFIGALARVAARRHRVPYLLIVQDVFPEIALQLGRLTNPLLVGSLDLLVGSALRHADRVVAIGDTMREKLIEKGVRAAAIEVIPNWVDADELRPQPKDNPWSREHGLAEAFVVMHSGNVGWAQDLDVLVRASTFLRDLEKLRFVVIGSGARQAEVVELQQRLESDGFVFLPYQPRDVLPASLSSADVHYIGLARGLAGYVVPSRMNGVLSVARPVIVGADANSEIVRVVERVGCGITVAPGRPELLAAAIRDAYERHYDLAEMGRKGRDYVLSTIDRSISIARYREAIARLVG